MSDSRHLALQQIAGPVSRETFEALIHFEAAFRKWSARINLVSGSTIESVWQRHILDSAQLVPLLTNACLCVDFGSGGGFPGAVVAILTRDNPDIVVNLVESDTRKAAFLMAVLGEIAPRCRTFPIRVERVIQTFDCPDVITARAFAPLPRLLDLAHPWLMDRARGLFHKGREFRTEIEKTRNDWKFDLVEHPSATNPGSVVIEISRLERNGATAQGFL